MIWKCLLEKTDLELMGVPGTIDQVEVVPGTVGFELQLAFAEAHQGRVVYFGKPHLDLTLHSQLEFGKPDLQQTFGMIGLYLAVAWNSGKADCDWVLLTGKVDLDLQVAVPDKIAQDQCFL